VPPAQPEEVVADYDYVAAGPELGRTVLVTV